MAFCYISAVEPDADRSAAASTNGGPYSDVFTIDFTDTETGDSSWVPPPSYEDLPPAVRDQGDQSLPSAPPTGEAGSDPLPPPPSYDEAVARMETPADNSSIPREVSYYHLTFPYCHIMH